MDSSNILRLKRDMIAQAVKEYKEKPSRNSKAHSPNSSSFNFDNHAAHKSSAFLKSLTAKEESRAKAMKAAADD